MTLKKILLNLAIALSALFFGLLWVGVYQFFVGKTLGDEMRPRIIQHLKEPKFDINDPDSVLPIDFEEDKLSDPKEDEDNPKYFDPEGTYFALDRMPSEFRRFEAFRINNKTLIIDNDGNYKVKEIAPEGYVSNYKKHEFKSLEITDGKISFQTIPDNGVNFIFVGEFLVKGNFYTLDENTKVIKGTLTKNLGDKKVVLKDISFGWMIDFELDEAEILDEEFGDLDGDGIDEKAVISQTPNNKNELVREIILLKKVNETWTTWKKSKNAVLDSDSYSFPSIKIEKNVLQVSFSGGSRWKWFYTDKYRYQNNDFELIGHESSYGALCQYWEYVDFNISTGKVVYEKEFEKCENGEQIFYRKEKDTFFNKMNHINLKNRFAAKMKIISPKYNREVYLLNRVTILDTSLQ